MIVQSVQKNFHKKILNKDIVRILGDSTELLRKVQNGYPVLLIKNTEVARSLNGSYVLRGESQEDVDEVLRLSKTQSVLLEPAPAVGGKDG